MSVKKNVAYNTLLNVLNVLFPIITVPYVSRVLGVENIGIINFAITYTSYFSLFALLGVPIYGMREIAKLNNDKLGRDKIFTELFFLVVINTIIVAIVYASTIFISPTLYNDKVILLIAGISVLLAPFNIDWFFSGRENFKIVAIRSLIVKLVTIGGLFIFVRNQSDVLPYLILTILANTLSHLWNFTYLLKKEVILRWEKINITKHIKPTLILFASSIAISAYTMINTLLLGFISDYKQVGYFTSAFKINLLILPIITSLSPVIIAKINTLKSQDSFENRQIVPLLNQSFSYMIMLALPATIGLMVISPRLVPFFFGEEFIPSILPMQILSLIIIVVGISNLFGMQGLIAMGYDKKFFICILSGAITSIFLNICLIKSYGAIGASIASVVAEIVVTIFTITFVLKIIPFKIYKKQILHPLLAAVPIIPTSLLFTNIINNNLLYLFVTITTSGILYSYIMIFILKNELLYQVLKKTYRKILKKI